MNRKIFFCIGMQAIIRSNIKIGRNNFFENSVDQIEIPSKRPGVAPLKRITEVFDCWFESGSMPFEGPRLL